MKTAKDRVFLHKQLQSFFVQQHIQKPKNCLFFAILDSAQVLSTALTAFNALTHSAVPSSFNRTAHEIPNPLPYLFYLTISF